MSTLGTGWASPALLASSTLLSACAQRVQRGSSSQPGTRAMAVMLAASLPPPCPGLAELLAAGLALQALVEQVPPPKCAASRIFQAPYCPAIAALAPAELLALLHSALAAALPAPTLDALAACLAQRYASLPPAQFEAEVGGPCPPFAALARAWWEAHFGAQQQGEAEEGVVVHQCYCTEICASRQASQQLPGGMPPLAFGLLPESPAREFWARGQDCSHAAQPTPYCAAQLAKTYGHLAWARSHWPAAAAVAARLKQQAALGPGTYTSALVALLQQQGAGDARVAHFCCLWLHSHSLNPSTEAPAAIAAAVAALRAHPGDACVAFSACAALRTLAQTFSTAPTVAEALLVCLPDLAALLHSPTLPPACACHAALSLCVILRGALKGSALHAAVLAAGLAPYLAELLQWRHYPRAQAHAGETLVTLASSGGWDAVLGSGALPHLVRLLDSVDSGLQKVATYLVGNMAALSSAARIALLEAGVVPPLLRALMPYARTVLVRSATRAAATLVQAVVKENAPQHCLAELHTLLPRLAALVTSEDLLVQAPAVQALGLLCQGGLGWPQAVLQLGCLGSMTALLGSSSDKVVAAALQTLRDITMEGGQLASLAVINEGALLHMGALLQAGCSNCKLACLLVIALCSRHSGCAHAVLEAGCMPRLIRCSESGVAVIEELACWALAQVCLAGGSSEIERLERGGVIMALARSLHSAHQSCVHDNVLAGLTRLLLKTTQGTAGWKALVLLNVPEAVQQLVRSKNEELAQLAAGFLELFFPEWYKAYSGEGTEALEKALREGPPSDYNVRLQAGLQAVLKDANSASNI